MVKRPYSAPESELLEISIERYALSDDGTNLDDGKELDQMKKQFLPIFASLFMLAAVSGCGVTEEEPSPGKSAVAEKMYPVHFVAEEIETSTAFGDAVTTGGTTSYPTYWTENDSKVAVSLNLSSAKGADVIPSEDFRMATFDAEFGQTEVTAPYTFYALSPFSAFVGEASSNGGFQFNILTEQTPLASSCDEGAQVMASSKEVESIADFGSVDLHFSHVTAYGKMTLKNVTLPADAIVLSIELTASHPFAGRFFYKFADATLEESASSRTVTLKPDNIALDENGTTSDIWFACAPVDLSGGTFKVEVNTSLGVLSRTVDIQEGKLAFQRGCVSKFTVNMSTATFTEVADRWALVTDAAMLAAGDEIIIASSATPGNAYAISTTQNNNNRGRVSVTIAQDLEGQKIIQNPGSTVEVLKLVAGYHAGYYYLQEATSMEGRYLFTTNSSSNNYLRSADPNTASSSTNRDFANWLITIDSSTAAYLSTYGSFWSSGRTYYKQIRHSDSSSLFSAYNSSSQASWSNTSTTGTSNVYIYRKEAGVNPDADPILEQDQYGAYLSGGNRIFGAGDQLSREYIGDGTVTFAILTPSTYAVTEFNGIPINPAKGESFTLNFNRIIGYDRADQDYEVTVVKVDGPKVWLTTGSGEGFIVKK